MCYTPVMVDSAELSKLLEGLMKEHDALLQEREVVRQEEEKVKRRREELDRKITGLQQSLQGLSLYSTAQHEPTEVTVNLQKAMAITKNLSSLVSREMSKSLIECCREILTRNQGW